MCSCEEVVEELQRKLLRNEPLTETDKQNLQELCELTGWDEEDVRNALIGKTPQFYKYFMEARRHELWLEKKEAARKLWGALTALLCSNIKEVCTLEARIDDPLTDSLMVYAKDLYRHIDDFPTETFRRRFRQCIKLFNELIKRRGGLIEEKRAVRKRKLEEICKLYQKARDLLEEIEIDVEDLVKANDKNDFICYSEDDFAPLRLRRQELEYRTDKGYEVYVAKDGSIYLFRGLELILEA